MDVAGEIAGRESTVDVASETSFESDFEWDIDQQVDETGDSDEDEKFRPMKEGNDSRQNSQAESVVEAAVAAAVPGAFPSKAELPIKAVKPPLESDGLPRGSACGTEPGVLSTLIVPEATANKGRADEANTDEMPVRIEMKWTKLRAIAYISGMHVFSREKCRAFNLLTTEYVVASGAATLPHQSSVPSKSAVHSETNATWMQGDLDMYSPANQKKRKRLKEAEAVQANILTLWNLATAGREETSGEFFLSKGDFLDIMVKLHILIVSPPVDLARAMSNALKDWQKDNGGCATMNRARFIDSMFELVDIWTETAEEQEYLDLIGLITQGITKIVPRIGSLCWKPNHEIKYDPRITKVALTMDDLIERDDEEQDNRIAEYSESDHLGEESKKGLCPIHSFMQAKQRNSAAVPYDDETKARKRAIAMRRWKKAVSAAIVMARGSSTNIYHFIQKGNKKQARMTVEKLLMTIAKIYKAKAQVETKMAALEKDEGQLAVGKRRKHHRLDRFLLQYHIRQFGTKTLARKKMRQFVSSISTEGTSHPRIELFAKLSGIPVTREDVGRSFRPFALTDYFLPIVLRLVPPGEELDHYMGVGREPTLVSKGTFISAVARVLKSVPDHSQALRVFYQKIATISDATDQRKGKDQARAITRRARQLGVAHAPGHEKSLIRQQGTVRSAGTVNESPTTRLPSARDAPPKSSRDHGHRAERGGRKYVDLDKALLAVVPLWEAEEAWRLWNHTMTAAILTKRWIRRLRAAKLHKKSSSRSGQRLATLPPSPREHSRPDTHLPPVVNPSGSPRSPGDSRKLSLSRGHDPRRGELRDITASNAGRNGVSPRGDRLPRRGESTGLGGGYGVLPSIEAATRPSVGAPSTSRAGSAARAESCGLHA